MVTVSLSSSDNILLDEIIEIGKKMEELIITKAGLVDDPVLRYNYIPDGKITDTKLKDNGLLALAKTHFQIIRMAKEGKLTDKVIKFEDYVYPRELNIKIENNINDLQDQLRELNK